MDTIITHDYMPLGIAALSFAGYIAYMKQTEPEEDDDYGTAAKISTGVALLSYVVQQGMKLSGPSSEDVLDGPFIPIESS